MSRDISKLLTVVEDKNQLQNLIDQSESKLILLDCYQQWCGPAEVMYPTLTRILLDFDNVDERFTFAVASFSNVGYDTIQSLLPEDESKCLSIEKNGCLPLYLIFRVSNNIYSVLSTLVNIIYY